ncbi:hypothetical protein H0H92_007976, partial [Tricholoma furcatifolium]
DILAKDKENHGTMFIPVILGSNKTMISNSSIVETQPIPLPNTKSQSSEGSNLSCAAAFAVIDNRSKLPPNISDSLDTILQYIAHIKEVFEEQKGWREAIVFEDKRNQILIKEVWQVNLKLLEQLMRKETREEKYKWMEAELAKARKEIAQLQRLLTLTAETLMKAA